MELNSLSLEDLKKLKEQFENGEFKNIFDQKQKEQQIIQEKEIESQKYLEQQNLYISKIKQKGSLSHYTTDEIIKDLITEFKKISAINISNLSEIEVLNTLIKKYSLEYNLLILSSLHKKRCHSLPTLINQLTFKRLEKLGISENELINIETLYPNNILNYALYCNDITISQYIENITEYFPIRINEDQRHMQQLTLDEPLEKEKIINFICCDVDYGFYYNHYRIPKKIFPHLKLSFQNKDMTAIYNFEYKNKELRTKQEQKEFEKELNFITNNTISEKNKQEIKEFLIDHYLKQNIDIQNKNKDSLGISGKIQPLSTNNNDNIQSKYYLSGPTECYGYCQGTLDNYSSITYINEEEQELISKLIDENYTKKQIEQETNNTYDYSSEGKNI